MKKKHWYKFFIGECPECGRDKSYKVRVCGKKPKSKKKRYVYLADNQTYDNCIRI